MKRWCTTVAALLLVTATAACGDDDPAAGDPAGDGGATLTVFAAASLTSSFEQLGESFEKSHGGVQVDFNFAGSSDLVAQVQSGAPADVFASADEANMDKLTADDLHGSDPELFATTPRDRHAVGQPRRRAVPRGPGRPRHQPGHVPRRCRAAPPPSPSPRRPGSPSSRTARSSRVTRRCWGKVTSGEADAGLVYVTDVDHRR